MSRVYRRQKKTYRTSKKKKGLKKKKTMSTKKNYANGFASLIESDNASWLRNKRIPFDYESIKIPWVTVHTYNPDFHLLHNGIIVETKGKFVPADRRKHLEVRKQHPDLDIRFVFQKPNNKLYKRSKTTYGQWADRHKFKWATLWIPKEWLEEEPNEASMKAIKELQR